MKTKHLQCWIICSTDIYHNTLYLLGVFFYLVLFGFIWFGMEAENDFIVNYTDIITYEIKAGNGFDVDYTVIIIYEMEAGNGFL